MYVGELPQWGHMVDMLFEVLPCVLELLRISSSLLHGTTNKYTQIDVICFLYISIRCLQSMLS